MERPCRSSRRGGIGGSSCGDDLLVVPLFYHHSGRHLNTAMNTGVVLIGSIGTGKSTLARLLSESLGLPRCCMDILRWPYMKEVGYDEAVEQRIKQQSGWRGVFEYWKPFEAHLVERLLAEHPGHVIDFGASQSVYEDDAEFAR